MHVVANVGQHYILRLLYHSSYPEVEYIVFRKCGWSDFYWNAEDGILMNAPEPQGKDICMFVDNDHATDKVSCRSRSDFLIYMNDALVQWYSKKQSLRF